MIILYNFVSGVQCKSAREIFFLIIFSGRYNSSVCSSLTSPSSISGVAVLRGGVVISLLGVVVMCCSAFRLSVEESLVQLRNDTGSFPVWFPEDCSVASTYFCIWFPLGGDVWLALFVYKVKFLLVLFLSSCFVMISVGCCQTISGIGGSLVISFVSGLSRAVPEWRRGVVSLKVGLQLGHSHPSYLEYFSVGLGFVLPAVYSWEAVCSLRLLHGSISLWSGLFCHMSHRVKRQV